jgi:sulfite exporter TauE/SafE/copper chaperone CopZ
MMTVTTSAGGGDGMARPTTTGMHEVRVPVAGMTCRACETRVSRALTKVPGVESAVVSVRRGEASLIVADDVDRPALERSVEAAVAGAGYRVGREPWVSPDVTVWREALVAVAVVAVGAVLVTFFGLPDLLAGSASTSSGSLLVVLLVGLAAGVSTCMALVGGLVLAVSASHASAVGYEDGRPRPGSMRPHLVFQAGRIVGFALLGAALGAIGAQIGLPERAQAVLTLAVALVMVVLGIRLLRVSPRLAAWSPSLPPSLARALGVEQRSAGPYSDARTAALGALTFFLPCGFTQAMQLYAMTTGSALTAGITMAVFAIGTAPGLLAVAGLPRIGSAALRQQVLAITGAVLVAFALVNASGAAGLLGWTQRATEVPTAITGNVSVGTTSQTVTMEQTTRGYVPQTTVVKPGVPIRWEITSVSDLSCAAYLRGVSWEWKANLKTGANVVELPALAAGERYDFACVMGMYNGSLVAAAA